MKKNEGFVGVRVSHKLKVLISTFIESETYMNISDFVREAVREKIQREAPQLTPQIHLEVSTNE